jgi:hypothetical protein
MDLPLRLAAGFPQGGEESLPIRVSAEDVLPLAAAARSRELSEFIT